MTAPSVEPEPARPTHSAGWYQPLLDAGKVRIGHRLMIPCVDGPTPARLEEFPPVLEIEVAGGVYVLDDDGPVHAWRYHFVAQVR